MNNERIHMDKALAIIPRTVGEVDALSARFVKSTLIPAKLRGNESDVFVTIMAGQELGLSPMASLRGVHVIEGKPTLAADTMVAIVLNSGKAEYFRCIDATEKSVTYETKRLGLPEQRCTWTMADAERAGLTGKDNWKKYPRSMLKARARAELARDVYPDVLAGCYTDDEADEFRPTGQFDTSDAIDAEVAEPVFDLDGALVAIRETETEDDLRRLAKTFTDAPASAQEPIGQAYKARKEQFAAAKAAA